MTDIVWLLRNDVPCGAGVCCAGELCNQAADEIERLRAALHPFAEAAGKFDPDEGDGSQHVWGWSPTIGMLRKARAALQDKSDE